MKSSWNNDKTQSKFSQSFSSSPEANRLVENMTLNPYAECFAPAVVGKKIQIVLNPSASTFYPQNPEKTSNENKQPDLRLDPRVKEFSPKERCQCSMNLKSSNPCSLLYPSDFNDISAVNLVNSALFVSNSAIDENDDDNDIIPL